MARIWMSGLEAGHMDVFDSIFGAAISAMQARTGGYSFYLGATTHTVRTTFVANISELFCRFGIRANYPPLGGAIILGLQDSNGDRQFTLVLNRYLHTLEIHRGAYDGALLGLGPGGIIHQNRWHCVELHLSVADAGGVAQVKVDGTLIIDYTGDTQETGNANVQAFSFGQDIAGGGVTGYYDDIAFNDTLGGVNTTWIGRGGIPAIFPTGAGNSTDLTPLVGANWEDVDERPPDDDTTYVFSDTINEHDSYETEDLPATGTIAAVQWLTRAKSDLVGNPEIMRVLRIGGVDYDGAVDIAIDADYDYYPEILDEDPDVPGAWTVAAVNGMELGVKIR